jgi:hypothetical protein
VEYLALALGVLFLLFGVGPFLILGLAFWIVRRCARRRPTVFWQGGVYGTGAGLATLTLYTLASVATADPNAVVWDAPTDALPLRGR